MLYQFNKLFYYLYNFFLRYPTPSNLGFLWNYGVSSLVFLVIQVLTGFFLSMNYVASADLAFECVEGIMRDTNFGWLIRYIHSNGASFFFICVYIHMFRGLYYFSFLKPRQNVWNIGVVILLLMIITAFTGYVLPWGQMSFWAATVITNLASAVPVFGDIIVVWLWGGFSINTFTLNRFFSIHYLLPFVILFLVAIHIIFLHEKGSSNRLFVTYKIDKIMFHPYFTIKDLFFILVIMLAFFIFLFFEPNTLSHPDNYIPADPLVTPAHIVPEWYFSPFYAMLRSIPSKLGGVLVLIFSIIVLLIFPIFFTYKNTFSAYNFKINSGEIGNENINFINSDKLLRNDLAFNNDFEFFVESGLIEYISYRFYFIKNAFKESNLSDFYYSRLHSYIRLLLSYTKNIFSARNLFFFIFVLTWFILTIVGSRPIDFPYLIVGRIFTFMYFMYFFLIVVHHNIVNIKISIVSLLHYLQHLYINIYIPRITQFINGGGLN